MRRTTQAVLNHYLDSLDVKGDVLEIGGFKLAQCAIGAFPAPRYRYRDCDIESSDIPDTIIADITDCADVIPDESFDVVLSCDVFEHIDRPWLAAAEIARILRPGGIVLTRTVWSWRNHPCPIDYWRFSPECLEFLFRPLTCLEKGYDLSERRVNSLGFWPNGMDSVPVDAYGGFRENWAVYSVHRKGDNPNLPQFKHSAHPLAVHHRQDTQGTVTNPKMLGLPPTPDALAVANRLDAVTTQLNCLEKGLTQRVDRLGRRVSDQLGAIEKGLGKPGGVARVRSAAARHAPRAAQTYRQLRQKRAGD